MFYNFGIRPDMIGERMKNGAEEILDVFELLPRMVKHRGSRMVIKYGGNAMVDEKVQRWVVKDIVFLELMGVKPIIVHGGGPAISEHMKKVGLKPEFVEGQRKTDSDALEIVEMVLCGKVNNQIVKLINTEGTKAIGLSGKDGGLITARKHMREVMRKGTIDSVDLGHVGEVSQIDANILDTLSGDGFIPVIAPIGVGEDNQDYNINADLLAGEVARSVKADRLIYLTDVDGILADPSDPSSLIRYMDVQEVKTMINDVISGGMIPKAESCIRALEGGVVTAHILNGTKKHALLKGLLTEDGGGTTIQPGL
jgi:acetylglutamate kinase